jgi:4-hydroxy-2-oxoheptanedioate aldolase
MIEDPEAIDHLEEIIAVLKPGRDIVMFGKADYGQALGGLREDGTFPEEVQEGYLKTIEICKKHNIWFMACPSAPATGQKPEHVQKVIDEGGSIVCLNTDQLVIADALDQIVSKCKNMRLA